MGLNLPVVLYVEGAITTMSFSSCPSPTAKQTFTTVYLRPESLLLVHYYASLLEPSAAPLPAAADGVTGEA